MVKVDSLPLDLKEDYKDLPFGACITLIWYSKPILTMPLVYKWYIMERDMLEGIMDMLIWIVGWRKLVGVDKGVVISMAPRVTLKYSTWWVSMCPCLLGLDELEGSGDNKVNQSF